MASIRVSSSTSKTHARFTAEVARALLLLQLLREVPQKADRLILFLLNISDLAPPIIVGNAHFVILILGTK